MFAGLDVAIGFERFVQELGASDQRHGFAVGQQKLDLARLVEHVDRHHDAAGLENAEIADDELGNVGQHEQHLLARLQSRACTSELASRLVSRLEFGIGQFAIAANDGGAIGKALGVFRSARWPDSTSKSSPAVLAWQDQLQRACGRAQDETLKLADIAGSIRHGRHDKIGADAPCLARGEKALEKFCPHPWPVSSQPSGTVYILPNGR